jgi:uncharacterized protein
MMNNNIILNASLPQLIKSLLKPECYPHPTHTIELIETHISWLLLAGEFVYKIKKPITLPFLDYGTLEKRRACCEAELHLNQRYAPDIYLEVVTIVGTVEHPYINSDGVCIEFAVKMRRFDTSDRLDHVCDRGELQAKHIHDLAKVIATFHSNTAKANVNSPYGSPERVIAPMLENFNELRSMISNHECITKLDALEVWTQQEFEHLTPKLIGRKTDGYIRECHGDLHLGNLVLINGYVRLFDCIEFNEEFRWIDVVSDIAFTYIDLLDHHQAGLAGRLLNDWLCLSGDFDGMLIFRLYAVYRALIRAKVAAIKAEQCHEDTSEVHRYIVLAEQIASPPKAKLIITHGLSGSGKTTAANTLLLNDNYGCTICLRSDIERKRLFGLTATDKSNSTLAGGIYTQEAHHLTYLRLHDIAESLLVTGWSVIVDAAFLKYTERTDFHNLAIKSGVDFHILAPKATLEELRIRILDRLEKGHDASEATIEVLEHQVATFDPLKKDELSYLV